MELDDEDDHINSVELADGRVSAAFDALAGDLPLSGDAIPPAPPGPPVVVVPDLPAAPEAPKAPAPPGGPPGTEEGKYGKDDSFFEFDLEFFRTIIPPSLNTTIQLWEAFKILRFEDKKEDYSGPWGEGEPARNCR